VLPGPGALASSAPSSVVASFYPLAWAASQQAAPTTRVEDLTPPGAEPHDLELTPGDRDAIEEADLVIVLGGGFQPAIEQAADKRDGRTLVVLDELSRSVRRRAARDPHVWLDPVVMSQIAEVIGAALGARTTAVSETLDALHQELETGLSACRRDVIVTAHDAFGWLARRYDLRQEGIAGVDPETEPNPNRIAELADLVEREHVTTIFTEDLVSPKVARTLAREVGGVRVRVLSPLESLTEAQRDRGDDYVDVMRANLRELRAALDCA
jgi:zinc transport system substrate-binding protein